MPLIFRIFPYYSWGYPPVTCAMPVPCLCPVGMGMGMVWVRGERGSMDCFPLRVARGRNDGVALAMTLCLSFILSLEYLPSLNILNPSQKTYSRHRWVNTPWVRRGDSMTYSIQRHCRLIFLMLRSIHNNGGYFAV